MTKNDPSSIIQIARENGNSEDGLPLNLGLRVRELRKARNWDVRASREPSRSGPQHPIKNRKWANVTDL